MWLLITAEIFWMFKGEMNPKIDFSSFEHLGIVEQLCDVF